MAKRGLDILLYMNGNLIAGTKTDELTVEGSQIEVTSENSGRWRDFLPGKTEWGVTTNFVVVADASVRMALLVNQTFTLKMVERGAPDIESITGTAILKSFKLVANIDNIVTGSFVFKGKGALV